MRVQCSNLTSEVCEKILKAPFLFKSKIDRVFEQSVRNEVGDLKLNRKLREIKKHFDYSFPNLFDSYIHVYKYTYYS